MFGLSQDAAFSIRPPTCHLECLGPQRVFAELSKIYACFSFDYVVVEGKKDLIVSAENSDHYAWKLTKTF